jgi:hypothetical protein
VGCIVGEHWQGQTSGLGVLIMKEPFGSFRLAEAVLTTGGIIVLSALVETTSSQG